MPEISVILPCRKRGHLLENTLASIRKQTGVSDVEIIVVEDGQDGVTEKLSRQYNATYIPVLREFEWPEFQSISKIMNTGIGAVTCPHIVLQSGEIYYENPSSLQAMQDQMNGGCHRAVCSLVRETDMTGRFVNWMNHPREGTRPRWIMGGAPLIMETKIVRDIGGYDEGFFGYGCEDDCFMFMLRRRKIETEYCEPAVAVHQWHPRPQYEPLTGHANRSLFWRMELEMVWESRPPIANYVWHSPVTTSQDLSAHIDRLRYFLPEYEQWVESWFQGVRDPDKTMECFAQGYQIMGRSAENADRYGYYAVLVCKAAWAKIWAKRCLQESEQSIGSWSNRLYECYKTHSKFSETALKIAQRVADGDALR